MVKGIDADEVAKVLKTTSEMNQISLDDLKKYTDIVEVVFTHDNVSNSTEFKKIYEKYSADKEKRAKKLEGIEVRRQDAMASMKTLCNKYGIDYGAVY